VELTLRHLLILCTVEDAGSIGKAAPLLALSQPALTAQLRRIESQLGEQVFARSSSGVRVTRTGRRVLTHARTALGAVAALKEETQALGADPRCVRIGGHGPLLLGLIDRLTAEGTSTGPLVARAEKSAHLLQAELERDMLDFALIREYPNRPVPLTTGIEEWELVDREPLFVGLSRQHPLVQRTLLCLDDLRDEPWALDPDDDTGENELLLGACKSAGFEPKVGLSSNDNGMVRSYVGTGRVVCLFEARAAEDDDLVVRPLRDGIHCRIVLRWRDDPGLVEFSDAVVAALTAAYADVVAQRPVFRAWLGMTCERLDADPLQGV
jgi:DNA-binding transcriptional LysR family regulator